MALDLFNEVTLTATTEGGGEENIIHQAIRLVAQKAGKSIPPFSLCSVNNIPLARGLGSSAAAIACGLLAANHLLGEPFSKEQLAELGTELEGHPDNVVPAIFGGCRIVIKEDDKLIHFPIPIPEGLKAILFIPHFPMPTQESRQILPRQVLIEDAVYNISRTALLVAAFFSGKLEFLSQAMKDKLHQPARSKLFPAMEVLFDAALKAGALGVCLSGGGSSVLALSRDKEEEISLALKEAASKAGVSGKLLITRPTEMGAYLVEC